MFVIEIKESISVLEKAPHKLIIKIKIDNDLKQRIINKYEELYFCNHPEYRFKFLKYRVNYSSGIDSLEQFDFLGSFDKEEVVSFYDIKSRNKFSKIALKKITRFLNKEEKILSNLKEEEKIINQKIK